MSLSSFFSRKGQIPTEGVSDIPEEVRQAVTTMGRLDVPESVSKKSEAETSLPQRSSSPFLEESGAATIEELPEASVSLAPNWTPPAAPELKPLFEANPQAKKTEMTKKWYLFGGIGVVALLFTSGVVWWFFFRLPEKIEVVTPVVEVQVVPQITPEKPQDPPYSLVSPNYLSLDTESITPALFREVLKQPIDRIYQSNIGTPVEFLLTDKNNNPLAFSRFAYLMNLDLKPDFLATIGESFSLFLYNDQGKITLGLGLTITTDGVAYLSKDGFLPYAFRNIFFDALNVPKDASFRSGVYNTQPVRFVNIDAAQNTSFDYAIRDKNWFIGTSKDTLRAILDKRQ